MIIISSPQMGMRPPSHPLFFSVPVREPVPCGTALSLVRHRGSGIGDGRDAVGVSTISPRRTFFLKGGLTVCECVCVRIEGVGAGECAKAGLGPRRSACRPRLHRHEPGQPVCAEPICAGDPDAGAD